MLKSRFPSFCTIFSLLVYLVFVQDIQGQTDLSINEFMANNVLAYENIDGEYEDWIEIYNSGSAPIDLAGYYLTDNLDGNDYWQIPAGQPSKTTIPANGYVVLYADKKTEQGAQHLGFKLDNDCEQVVLIAPNGATIIDSVSYRDQFRDISYGRFPDGGSQWVYFTQITPGSANKPGYSGFISTPTINQPAGFYTGGVTISVQPNRTGDTIRYTLDGSDPAETAPQYIADVQLDRTTIFKAKAFNSSALPSPIATRAFFVNAEHTLPVLTVMTDPKNLFDPVTGIYVHDYDGRTWERFCEMEYFRNQTLEFHVPAGLHLQGNTGPKDYDKKSFRAYFRNGYGQERMEYALYPQDSVTTFARLVLRSGYDDSLEPTSDGKNAYATLLRDPLVTELWRRTGELTPQNSFAVLYLNTDFYGIYDIKQSIDEDFIKDHLGYQDLDLMRTRWDSTELVYGDRNKWKELINFFKSNTFTSDAKIASAAQIMDLDNFTTLQALMHATEYRGWAYGVFMLREKVATAQWQWTIWDADRSCNDVNWNGFTNQYNPLGIYLDTLITKKLLENQSYKNHFINRIADLLNTVFTSENVKAIIDSLAANIAPEIPAETEKWNSTVAKWNENVAFLKNFAAQRPEIVRQQMQNYFQLEGQSELTVDIVGGKGHLKINSLTVSQFPWSGQYFQNIPVTVTAVPAPGYRFTGWSDPSLPVNESITLNLTGDKSISAIFNQLGDANAELIAPNRIISGQRLPVVVRIRNSEWNINPVEQTPMQVKFDGAHTDTLIQIKRGAGTGVFEINSSANSILLSVQNENVPLMQKQIGVTSMPTISYSGTLPDGNVVWDNSADRLITADITIPADCHLTIKQGAWILIKKYVNFYVQGDLTVEGTASEPVVITSENWSEPWGGMEFNNATATFRYCIVLNGGGDVSKGHPTDEDWHTGHQHIFFGKDSSVFNFDQCFFLNSPGKVFGAQDSRVTVTNSVSSFVWHGGEFHRVSLFYQDSHLMNLPNDDHIYTEDIDTDGLHIDYVSPDYPQYSVIDRCYFVTGKDDAIDHHASRLRISNCWLEDFIHEGVAASGGDTVKIFNTVSINNDQGFEAGWTEDGISRGPYVLIDHCVAVDNNVGLRIGDSYSWSYRDFMQVTNSVIYNNTDNIKNYLNSTLAPLAGALDISHSMTNDLDYDDSPHCISGVPQFDSYYYLLPGSLGYGLGTRGTDLGRADSTAIYMGAVVINEIMYNAPTELDSKDWIELFNPQPVPQDISGWVFKDDDNSHQYQIPSAIVIPADGYQILCADTSAFKQFYPKVNNISGNIPYGFGDNDQVRLYNSARQLIDSVAYDNDAPWPGEADGDGYTLELLNPGKDHTLPENWAKSILFGGSPGKANQTTGIESKPESRLPAHFVLEQNFPNPFNPVTYIAYTIPAPGKVRLIVYDLLGKRVLELPDELRQIAGSYRFFLDASNLSSGIYFYQVQFIAENGAKQIRTKKMVLIK